MKDWCMKHPILTTIICMELFSAVSETLTDNGGYYPTPYAWAKGFVMHITRKKEKEKEGKPKNEIGFVVR